MITYRISIRGVTPLLMHADNIDWADAMNTWRSRKENKQKSKAGDDRTPAFRWLGCLYHDGTNITVPAENLMRSLMEAATQVPVPGGRGGKTFKAQSQSGILPSADGWPLLLAGRPVPVGGLLALRDEDDFTVHRETAAQHGFELFSKRARIGSAKHVRIRPLFREWGVEVELMVIDKAISREILQEIFEVAGRMKGLGDWRPSSRTPGRFGMFSATGLDSARLGAA